ncbi:ankyrin repeat-containing domain protein [Aspergillus aurantiobrunneus]
MASRDITATAVKSLDAGPYTKVTRHDNTPLIIASMRGSLGVAKQLLTIVDQGLDIEARGQLGRTALAHTACYGKTDAVKLLLERGALNTVNLLLEQGAEVDSRTRFHHNTPLSLAARQGHDTVVKRLLEAGADPNTSSAARWTALHHAAYNRPRVKLVITFVRGRQ